MILNLEKFSKKVSVSKPWNELECPASNPDGKPLSKEKLNDFKKHLDLYPPEARKFYEKLITGNLNDDIDNCRADDIDEDY